MHSRNRPVETPSDPVNSPDHYKSSRLECIDAMAAMVENSTLPPHQAHCWQTSFKYLWRWTRKNTDRVEDLKKCRWYLDRLIQQVEGDVQ